MSVGCLVQGALFVVVVALAMGCPRGHATSAGVATRVVSLSPSTSETLFAIGAKDAVVGRSRYCDYPKDLLAVPVVGGYVDPNYEAILALHPDLVTGARGPSGPEVTERFLARRIATYFPDTESFAGIDAMILGLGARTGHTEGASDVVVRIHARIAEVERSLEGKGTVRALVVYGLAPVVVAGPASFADEMIRRAGGDNVVHDGGRYPTLGIEKVLALDPDVIVDAAMGESSGVERITKDTQGWREARAVKIGRVVPLNDEVVLRPGPRVGEGLAILARAIHDVRNETP